MDNLKSMKHNTPYRVTKGNTDGGIVAGDIVSYDSSGLVMWDGKYTRMYDNKDLSIPQISDFECEVAEGYQIVKKSEENKVPQNKKATEWQKSQLCTGKTLGKNFGLYRIIA